MISPEEVLTFPSPNTIEATPEKLDDDSKPCNTDNVNNSNQPLPPEVVAACSSPNIIESTPEKLEDYPKSSSIYGTTEAEQNNTDKEESQDVKFLFVNKFRLSNDKERTMCIKQQKNSWLQLNDSKKDFHSVEKSSVVGPLSTLKRDREENTGNKRAKRKISDYFPPKN